MPEGWGQVGRIPGLHWPANFNELSSVRDVISETKEIYYCR